MGSNPILSATLRRAGFGWQATESYQSGHETSTKAYLRVTLRAHIAVETEAGARQLEQYFKTGSGKAFADKRFWQTLSRWWRQHLSI